MWTTCVISSFWKPRNPIWKDIIYNTFKVQFFTSAAKIKLWLQSRSVNKVFSNYLGSQGAWRRGFCWISYIESFHYFCFQFMSPSASLFRKMRHQRFTVKLQKLFVDYYTSPNCPSASGQVDTHWIFNCGWTSVGGSFISQVDNSSTCSGSSAGLQRCVKSSFENCFFLNWHLNILIS